jgi:hypothetical protein
MVLIKHAALLKTCVGFGEGEIEDLDEITRPKPKSEGDCTLLCKEVIIFYYCTWQYLV